MIVPFSFVFKCQVSKIEWKEKQENRVEGYYIFDTYIDLTVEKNNKINGAAFNMYATSEDVSPERKAFYNRL